MPKVLPIVSRKHIQQGIGNLNISCNADLEADDVMMHLRHYTAAALPNMQRSMSHFSVRSFILDVVPHEKENENAEHLSMRCIKQLPPKTCCNSLLSGMILGPGANAGCDCHGCSTYQVTAGG